MVKTMIALLGTVALLSGCGFVGASYEERVWEVESVSDEFLNAIDEFAIESSMAILNQEDTNEMYSPISLYMALSVLSEGATNETRDEILSVLNIEDIEETYFDDLKGLMDVLNFGEGVNVLNFANSVWIDETFKVKGSYVVDVNDIADVFRIDLSDDTANELMSEWIENETNGKLSRDSDANPVHIMSIINAIYLYAEWEYPFIESSTEFGIFNANKGEVEVEFMRKVEDTSLIETKNYSSVSLQLKDIGWMNFYLPSEKRTISDLLKDRVFYDMLNKSNDYSEGVKRRVNILLPKFDYKTKYDLAESMKAMGLEKAFGDYAEFYNIYDNDAYGDNLIKVNKIEQKSFISIDETGVEAAAYTEVSIDFSSAPLTTEFNLNRPFIYTITTNDNIVLFIGVINDPSIVG